MRSAIHLDNTFFLSSLHVHEVTLCACELGELNLSIKNTVICIESVVRPVLDRLRYQNARVIHRNSSFVCFIVSFYNNNNHSSRFVHIHLNLLLFVASQFVQSNAFFCSHTHTLLSICFFFSFFLLVPRVQWRVRCAESHSQSWFWAIQMANKQRNDRNFFARFTPQSFIPQTGAEWRENEKQQINSIPISDVFASNLICVRISMMLAHVCPYRSNERLTVFFL